MRKRVVIYGVVVGILAGCFSILYRLTLEKISSVRNLLLTKNDGLDILIISILMILMGVVVHFLLKWQPLSSGSGIPQVQAENLGIVSMQPFRLMVAKFLGGMAGNFGGLSLGREGPSIQIGAVCGKAISKVLHLDNENTVCLVSAGASAGLSAAFNAPLAGTLFTLEEMHKKFVPLLMVPALIASVVADFISKNIFGIKPIFSFNLSEPLPLQYYGYVVVFGIFVGLGGIAFNKTLMLSLKIYDSVKVKSIIKHIFPFIISTILGFVSLDMLGVNLLGGGHDMIEAVGDFPISIGFLIIIFLLKFLFTCLSYGSGAQGGIFLPVLVLGGMLGAIFMYIINYLGVIPNDFTRNFIILGMVGYLTAVVRSPILSIMLVTEMTGQFKYILSLSIVSITAYTIAEISKTEPIYESLLNRLKHSVKVEKIMKVHNTKIKKGE